MRTSNARLSEESLGFGCTLRLLPFLFYILFKATDLCRFSLRKLFVKTMSNCTQSPSDEHVDI